MQIAVMPEGFRPATHMPTASFLGQMPDKKQLTDCGGLNILQMDGARLFCSSAGMQGEQ